MTRSALKNPEAEALAPVEQDLDVQRALAARRAAEVACREAGDQVATARLAAGRTFTETLAHMPTRSWTRRDFWKARRDLPELEQRFDEAQAALEDAQTVHETAMARAKAALEPRVRATFAPRFHAAVTALDALRPVLDDVAAAASEAAALGFPAPTPALVVGLLTGYRAALVGWVTPPPAPSLPAGMVLVTARQSFRLLAGGLDVNQQTGSGTVYLAGETLGTSQETADALVREGRAELAVR